MTLEYFSKLINPTNLHPYKPDFVELFCLRSDHEKVARTTISSVKRAMYICGMIRRS